MSYILDKKRVIFDPRAEESFRKLPEKVQKKFIGCFRTLAAIGYLEYPEARKITFKIFEIRVKLDGAWRGFYAYTTNRKIIVLHLFQKKSQKTVLKDINTASKRLKSYKNLS